MLVQLHLVDSMCGQADGAVERARFWLHRQAQAHKLYAAAEKSLLLIRGLIPAAVQPHDAVHADVMVEGCGNGKPHELADEMQQEASVTAESFTGVNCVAGRNGHAFDQRQAVRESPERKPPGKHPGNVSAP